MDRKKYIIRSLLDLDFYKLTMMQLVYYFFPNTKVVYAYKNRTTKIREADYIPKKKLLAQLKHVAELRFTPEEIEYLAGIKINDFHVFRHGFLQYLASDECKLNFEDLHIRYEDGHCHLEAGSTWLKGILWETIILSAMNELFYRGYIKKHNLNLAAIKNEGRKRLLSKTTKLKKHPHVRFIEFGTRRRFSFDWQEEVLLAMAREIPGQAMGTSNVYLAMKHGLNPVGTFAHEMFMVFSRLFGDTDDDIRSSHNKVLQHWRNFYHPNLLVALTDTYGSDFFFRDMTREQAAGWSGLRQDSGDPVEFGEKAIAFYEKHGIDPRTKLIVFSDGLDVDKIIILAKHFHGRINVSFGWGTNLTNDLGLSALSMVIKAVESNGQGTVKLSDNIAKAIGLEEDIAGFKRIFGYDNDFQEECKY